VEDVEILRGKKTKVEWIKEVKYQEKRCRVGKCKERVGNRGQRFQDKKGLKERK